MNQYCWPELPDCQVAPASVDRRMPSPTAQTESPPAAMAYGVADAVSVVVVQVKPPLVECSRRVGMSKLVSSQ